MLPTPTNPTFPYRMIWTQFMQSSAVYFRVVFCSSEWTQTMHLLFLICCTFPRGKKLHLQIMKLLTSWANSGIPQTISPPEVLLNKVHEQNNNNDCNDGYLEHPTCTGPKCLQILYKLMYVDNKDAMHTHTHTHTHMLQTHTHTHICILGQ